MLCDGSPDPTIAGEINAYISLWKEDETRVQVNEVLHDALLCLSLIRELEDVIDDTPACEENEKLLARYKQTVSELQEVLAAKLDRASHEVLLRATEWQDAETFNLQRVFQSADAQRSVALCLWGNLTPNTRIKLHEFIEKGMSFEVSRFLALSNCAVRVLFTRFDHLSPRCFSYKPRRKPPSPEALQKKAEEEAAEKARKEAELAAAEQAAADSAAATETAAAPKEDEDIMAALLNLDADEAQNEKKDEEKTENVETVKEAPIEEDLVKEPEAVDWEEFEGEADEVDLRLYAVVGEIIHFDLLNMPPQPKQANGWSMTIQVQPPALSFMDYVADAYAVSTPGGALSAPSAAQPSVASGRISSERAHPDGGEPGEPAAGKVSVAPGAGEKREEKPLVQVTLKLPPGYVYNEAPVVARWDEKHACWRQEGFEAIQFKEEERDLQFRTAFFGTLALMQDRYVNMPFQSWSLRPRAPGHCALTIIAAINEVTIDIRGEECCIGEPQSNKQIVPLMNKWMKPAQFIKALKEAGLNFFPDDDSDKYVSVQQKNAVAVARLYEHMALVSDACAFSWTHWNGDVKEPERLLVRAGEHLVDEPPAEDALSVFSVTRHKVTKLKIDEFAENFSGEENAAVAFHADFYHMYLNELASAVGKERVRTDALEAMHVEAVRQLLAATRILTYS